MLNPVKSFPSSFLLTSEPLNSGALEVSPEVSVRSPPFEYQGAARDWTCESRRPRIGIGRAWYDLQEGGRGGARVPRDRPLILGRGGGGVWTSGYIAS